MLWLMVTVSVSVTGGGRFGGPADAHTRMRMYAFDTKEDCVDQGTEWENWPAISFICLPMTTDAMSLIDLDQLN